MFFRDIIGQNEIKTRLIRSVKDGRVAHAQLFYGNTGVGCLPMALAYAQYICCENPLDNDSCGECVSCKKYAKLSHPDLHFVFPIITKKSSGDDGSVCDDFLPQFRDKVLEEPYLSLQDWQEALQEEKKPIIYTREGEEIIRKLNLKAFESAYKIMIIWCAEQMHEACANKVLKVLEEPQGQTLFILISDNIENIIATIRSRVQQVFFPPIDDEYLRDELRKRGLYDENAEFYIKNARGNINRLYHEIADNDTRTYYFRLFMDLMRGCWNMNETTFIEQWIPLLDQLTSLGRTSQIAFLQNSQRELRENFIYNLNVSNLVYMNREELDFAQKFARFVNERNIEQLMNEFALAESHIDQNTNSKYVFFDLMLIINDLLKK